MEDTMSVRLGPDCAQGIKKIQIGCGPKNILPDWWNVDIRLFPGIDEVMDATQPWKYQSLDFVYGEHFLEHLTLDGAISFLRNAWSSLKEEGVIRLSTPSLEWVLSTHFDLSESAAKKRIVSTFAMNRAFHGWGHHFLYSQEFLVDLLENIGFTKINFFEYGKSEHSELIGMERHGSYKVHNGYPSVWIVEATKKEKYRKDDISQYLHFVEKQYMMYVKGGH